jgi:hypothetical protein
MVGISSDLGTLLDGLDVHYIDSYPVIHIPALHTERMDEVSTGVGLRHRIYP